MTDLRSFAKEVGVTPQETLNPDGKTIDFRVDFGGTSVTFEESGFTRFPRGNGVTREDAKLDYLRQISGRELKALWMDDEAETVQVPLELTLADLSASFQR